MQSIPTQDEPQDNPQNDCTYRILLVCSHPVQYASPIFRKMAVHPRLQIEVAYCSLQGAEAGHDPDFGQKVKWDVPLLEGYPWTQVRNRAPNPRLGAFLGLLNTSLSSMVCKGRYDAVVIYTGYRYASFWITLVAAKFSRVPVLFGTDAASLDSRDGAAWKRWMKRRLWPLLFGLADQVIVPSTGSCDMMRSLGISDERLTLTPYVVDNEWWLAQAARVDRSAVRAQWEVPTDATVVLFCAKLQPWKRPLDLLRAFAKVGTGNSFLVFAGEGPLRKDLELEAASLGVASRVRMLGFVNQSLLPSVYTASDIFVLPSDYEPFGVVVNEAMLCGCAVAVSDRVGAGKDLVQSGAAGFIFPFGDVDALVEVLRDMTSKPEHLQQLRATAGRRMQIWSPRENIDALIGALDRVVSSRGVLRPR